MVLPQKILSSTLERFWHHQDFSEGLWHSKIMPWTDLIRVPHRTKTRHVIALFKKWNSKYYENNNFAFFLSFPGWCSGDILNTEAWSQYSLEIFTSNYFYIFKSYVNKIYFENSGFNYSRFTKDNLNWKHIFVSTFHCFWRQY